MPDKPAEVIVDLRIPGSWSGPQELLSRLPPGVKLTPELLTLPDGSQFEVSLRDADDQFAQVFRNACRRVPTEAERNTIDNYTVNIIVSGPGGSFAAAKKMMEAASAIIRAGGAGVFIDNSALSHGGENWLYMTEDGSSDALSFAFVAIIRSKEEVYTIGMHVLGLRDLVMKRADVEAGHDIVELICYVCAGELPVEDGHIIGDQDAPRFRVQAEPPHDSGKPPAMQNPFGRLRLVSLKQIAEEN